MAKSKSTRPKLNHPIILEKKIRNRANYYSANKEYRTIDTRAPLSPEIESYISNVLSISEMSMTINQQRWIRTLDIFSKRHISSYS